MAQDPKHAAGAPAGRPARPFVHERGLCESDDVGPGTRVWAFAHVMKGAIVGADCNVGDHAFVETGARIGDRVTLKNAVLVWDGVCLEDEVFVGPNAVFTNVTKPRVGFKRAREEFAKTLVRRGATIGANATILCGITIGERAFIGAGAVVHRDVPARALVVGNPARRIGWVCDCGEKLPATLVCGCGRRYELVDDTQGVRPAASEAGSRGS
jgi:acetyltransferase-like isoleucine patch superfamily enzyme